MESNIQLNTNWMIKLKNMSLEKEKEKPNKPW
jgi:hypothetical protein